MNIQDFNKNLIKEIEKFQDRAGKYERDLIHIPFLETDIPINSLQVLAGRPRSGRTSIVLDFIMRSSIIRNDPYSAVHLAKKGLVFFVGHSEGVIYRRWFNTVTNNQLSESESGYHLEAIGSDYLKAVEGAAIDINFKETTEGIIDEIRTKFEQEVYDYVLIDNIPFKYSLFDEWELIPYSNDTKLVEELIQLQREVRKHFLLVFTTGHDSTQRYGSNLQILEDLKSSYLEENADIISMINRPELYRLDTDDEGRSLKNVIDIDCLVNRFGEEGSKYWKIVDGIIALSKN